MRDQAKMRANEKKYRQNVWQQSIRLPDDVYDAMMVVRNTSGKSMSEFTKEALMEQYGNFPIEEYDLGAEDWDSDSE